MYRKMVQKIKPLFVHEDEQLMIVVPTCKKDFQQEGQNNHNCVGGYFERVLKGQCIVVFLRKKEEPEKAFCTVEFDLHGNVKQNRACYNRQAPEEAVQFINNLSKIVQKRIEKQIAANA